MQLKKINNIKKTLPPSIKSPYTFPKNNIFHDQTFFLSGIYGARGTGKSSVMKLLLENMPHFFDEDSKVYYISPTLNNDFAIYKSKNNFVHVDDLNQQSFNEIVDEIKTRIEKWKRIFERIQILNKYLHKEEISLADLSMLEESNFCEDIDIDKFNTSHPPQTCLIFDDNLASPLLSSQSSKAGKELFKFVLKHRHLYTHVFFLCQSYKYLQRAIRMNSNLNIFFPFRDRKVMQQVFDEFSGVFNEDYNNLVQCLDECENRRDHSFIMVYNENDKKEVRINFSELCEF